MNEASMQFHIKENDFFGTLATVLDLVSQDLRKKGHRSNAEMLGRQRDRLMYLQRRYRIAKIQPHSVMDSQGSSLRLHRPERSASPSLPVSRSKEI